MRQVPHDEDAEKAVIGSILLDNRNMRIISDKLTREDFFNNTNSIIYSVIQDMDRKGESIEPILLLSRLKDRGLQEKTGGIDYLNSLLPYSVSAKNIDNYIDILKEKTILRDLISVCSDIQENCYGNLDKKETLDNAEKDILKIIRRSSKQDFVSIDTVVNEVIENIESVYERKENIVGVPTGFTDLDEITSGFQKSDLIILAARPSMGKTSLALNIGTNAALRYNIPVAIFSLEMSAAQLVQRVIASEAEINQEKLKRGNLTESDFSRLVMAAGRIFDAPMYINDEGFMSINELKAAARKAKMENDIQLILIDYLQLLSGNSKESRTQEISEISRNLKALAKELDVPVVALSQLSRAVESRNDKRPMLSDLRESGAIEQDADMVIFIYRDDYYNQETKAPNITEILFAKNRNGSIGKKELYFQKELTKFRDYTRKSE